MKRFNLGPTLALTAVMLPAVVMLNGCNTTGCMDNRSSIPLAGFYSLESGTQIEIDSDNIGGVDAPGDSLQLKAGVKAKQVYLPFTSSKEQVSFFIDYAWEDAPETDILTFDYTSTPYFVSEECGAMYRYRITRFSHTSNLIDSVAILDSLITNVERVGIRIYYRTETSPEE